jgi:hypothetical protein
LATADPALNDTILPQTAKGSARLGLKVPCPHGPAAVLQHEVHGENSYHLLAVPFSAIGAIWFLYLMNYNMSIAVWGRPHRATRSGR